MNRETGERKSATESEGRITAGFEEELDIESHDLPPEQGVEENRGALSAEAVSSALTIDELIEAVAAAAVVEGEHVYTADYIADKIRDFKDFFEQKMPELQLSVILGRSGEINDDLTKKIIFIPLGLGLRKKVKDLMAKQWEEGFQNNRYKIIEVAIKQADSVEELCRAINYFHIIKGQGQNKNYNVAEAIANIRAADSRLQEMISPDDLNTVADVRKIDSAIRSVLDPEIVPQEFNIYDRAYKLIFNHTISEIKDRGFKSHISSISSADDNSGIWGGVKKSLSKLAFWRKKS